MVDARTKGVKRQNFYAVLDIRTLILPRGVVRTVHGDENAVAGAGGVCNESGL